MLNYLAAGLGLIFGIIYLTNFHQHAFPSYAHSKTIALARIRSKTGPEKGFTQAHEFKVGRKKVVAMFFGEGHTQDNVVGYFPEGKVLFGGLPD